MNLINEQSVTTSTTSTSEELSETQARYGSSLELSSSVKAASQTTVPVVVGFELSSSYSSALSSLSSSSSSSSFALYHSTPASVESINRQIEKISNKISFGDGNQINLIRKMPTTTTTSTTTAKPSAGSKTVAAPTTDVSLPLSASSQLPREADTAAISAAARATEESTILSTTTMTPPAPPPVEIDDISDVSDCMKYNKNGDIDNNNESTSSSSSPTPDKQRKVGCEHYKRRAMFVTPCCNKFYKCRYCHDENETHHFDRKTLTELICVECNTRQKVQEKCENCGVRFGKYTCLICNLFDDEDKNQYHCDDCGICRIGGRKNFFHCEVCNMCLPIELKIEGHRFVENISRSNCPVCLGAIHTSRIPCHIPDCGHLLHKMCFDQLLASGHYVCPTCQTSLLDMTKMWEYLDAQALLMAVPKKYENQRVYVFCNDCHETCKTKFHFVGLKCIHCGGYNTTQDVKRRMSWVNGADSSTSA